MRYVVLGFCVFASACAGEGASAPTSPSSSIGGAALTEAKGGSELPFKGTLEATQTSRFQPGGTILINLVGTGNATHLGRFTLTHQATVVFATGTSSGTGTWTAANGDQLFTTITGQSVNTAGILAIVETHTITGGTGRFVGASGTIILHRSLNPATGISSASITGTINLGH